MPDFSPHNIDLAERISRYIFIRKYFNPRTGNISPQVFKLPSLKSEEEIHKLSIYRTEGLDEAEVWALADDQVTKNHPDRLPALARADTQAQKVLDLDLKFDPNGVPHPRHANIVGWPDDEVARQMKAVSLAKSAQLVPR